MITPEEWEEIRNLINLAVEKSSEKTLEKALLILPDTMGNLMVEYATSTKLNKKFYEDYPEFKDKTDIVASVVEMVEGKNTLDKHEVILEKAVPEIRQRIKTMQSLDMKTVSPEPKRDFSNIDVPQADRVNPHGEI